MFLSDMYFRLLEVVKCISRLLFVVFERMYLVILLDVDFVFNIDVIASVTAESQRP